MSPSHSTIPGYGSPRQPALLQPSHKARSGSRDSEPDGFQKGRFGARDGEIGRLRRVMALDNCPPRAGDGRGERFEELSRRLFGGIGGGEQYSTGLEQPQRRARKFAVILFRPERALFLRSRKRRRVQQ